MPPCPTHGKTITLASCPNVYSFVHSFLRFSLENQVLAASSREAYGSPAGDISCFFFHPEQTSVHSKLEEQQKNSERQDSWYSCLESLGCFITDQQPSLGCWHFQQATLGWTQKIGQLANVEELMLAMASLHDCPHLSLWKLMVHKWWYTYVYVYIYCLTMGPYSTFQIAADN